MTSSPKLIRETSIAQDILWVDGISGTAKSMLFPILSSFQRVEVQRLEHIYEYLCILHHFGKIETDAAIPLMRIYADLAVHDNMISRETNFRPGDDSSVFNTPNSLTYLKRLFHKDGPAVLERIRQQKPILHVMTHQVLGVSDLAFRSYGERLKILVMIRHPLRVMPHWVDANWGERYGTDPKDVTLWLDHKGKALPWWARGWEEEYVKLSPIGRVVRSIDSLIRRMNNFYDNLSSDRKEKVLIVPFEQFASNPYPWMDRIETLLKTHRGPQTARMMKKQNVPRVLDDSDLGFLRDKYMTAIPEPEIRDLLDTMSQEYETRYGLSTESL